MPAVNKNRRSTGGKAPLKPRTYHQHKAAHTIHHYRFKVIWPLTGHTALKKLSEAIVTAAPLHPDIQDGRDDVSRDGRDAPQDEF
ncbi:hypothetical protein FRC08_000551 [Ceratobasidium sp. 394]|nr:hypothetical protein FRC08_000551 [Ceratobasidium sp. 394]